MATVNTFENFEVFKKAKLNSVENYELVNRLAFYFLERSEDTQ